MRIGELAEATDTSPRLLRYYEEQGLVIPRRLPNGYREYDDYLIDRVVQIRGLLDTGLPTRIIRQIMPCLGTPRSILFNDADPELIAVLEDQRDRMTQRIEFLIRNRDSLDDYLQAVR
jgi:DNA-binding transcriptional MerR regulator